MDIYDTNNLIIFLMNKKNNLRVRLIAVFIFLTNLSTVFGQNLLTEDFTGGIVPASSWNITGAGGASHWSLYNTNDAGSLIPEMYFTGWTALAETTRMTSPVMNTAGYSGLIIEWKHKILKGSNTTSTISIETSSDGITWNSVWSFSGTGFIGPETIVLPVSNSDVGSATFQFAFVVSGNTLPAGSFNSWRIDDIKVDAMVPDDVSPTISQIAPIIPNSSSIVPKAIVKNWSSSAATFDTKFEILDGTSVIYTSTKTVTSLASTATSYVSFDPWTATLGNYTSRVITMYGSDANTANDTLSSPIEVLDNVIWKTPLFEIFSSSYCGPCAGVNTHMNDLLAQNEGAFSLVKYQQSFPAPGDPYFIPAADDRRNYYDVSGIPAMEANGDIIGGAASYSQFDFNELSLETTQIEIPTVNSMVNSDSLVDIQVTLNPIANYPAGLILHTVIVEKITTQNIGDNTETEFHNVMMTMLPNSSGEILATLNTGVPVNFSYNFNMSSTFTEHLDNLAVVVFVQNDATKKIIQSKIVDILPSTISSIQESSLSDSEILIFPNPANEYLNIILPVNSTQENTICITDITGKIVLTSSFSGNKVQLNTSSLETGMYEIKIENKESIFFKRFVQK